jgi:TRAP transporter 4TM/12TM fusion protein
MGAAAFIMSDFLGTPYIKICVAAAIPAILYYWALFMMVDLEAAKHGLKGLPRRELPQFWMVMKDGWYFAVPIVIVVYLLAVVQYSPMLTAFWGIVANVALSWIKPRKAMGARKIFSALEKGAKGALQVALACACVGIVMGALTVTGLGLRLSSILTGWAQGNYFLLLFLTMIASLILGASLPTTPTYLFLAITVAPALVSLGMLPMAAHLFVFYFGAISDMTPPLAISGYIAAGIAGANPLQSTFLACRIGVAGFIIPFMFAYSPGYILVGNWYQIMMQIIPGVVGIAALAAALSGYLLIHIHLSTRVALFAAASLLIFPRLTTNLAGFTLIAIVVGQQLISRRKRSFSPSLSGTLHQKVQRCDTKDIEIAQKRKEDGGD